MPNIFPTAGIGVGTAARAGFQSAATATAGQVIAPTALVKLGFLANPWVSAAVTVGVPILNFLFRDRPRVVDTYETLSHPEKIYERFCYGGPIDIPGSYCWSASRDIDLEDDPLGRTFLVAMGLVVDGGEPVVKKARIVDRIIYLSEGELDGSPTSVKFDGECINLKRAPAAGGFSGYYIAESTGTPVESPYAQKFFVRPYYATTQGPTDLVTAYPVGRIYDWRPQYHRSSVSYAHIGFIEFLEANTETVETNFWSSRGIPSSITLQGKGMKLWDLSKYPNHRGSAKVWTNNPVSVLYDYLVRKGYRDSQFDWHWMMEGYEHCGQTFVNDFRKYDLRTAQTLGAGQIQNSKYRYYPTRSKRYSFSGIVDKNLDQQRETEDVLARIKTAFVGEITNTGNRIAPIVGKFRNPTITITNDMWVERPTRRTQPPVEDLYNVLTVELAPQSNSYETKQITLKNRFAIERDGREIPAPMVVRVDDCTDELEVWRKFKNLLKQMGKFELIEGSVIGNLDALVGETVSVVIDEEGINNGTYIVRESQYDQSPDIHATRLELVHIDAQDYSSTLDELIDGSLRRIGNPAEGLTAGPTLPKLTGISADGVPGGFVLTTADQLQRRNRYINFWGYHARISWRLPGATADTVREVDFAEDVYRADNLVDPTVRRSFKVAVFAKSIDGTQDGEYSDEVEVTSITDGDIDANRYEFQTAGVAQYDTFTATSTDVDTNDGTWEGVLVAGNANIAAADIAATLRGMLAGVTVNYFGFNRDDKDGDDALDLMANAYKWEYENERSTAGRLVMLYVNDFFWLVGRVASIRASQAKPRTGYILQDFTPLYGKFTDESVTWTRPAGDTTWTEPVLEVRFLTNASLINDIVTEIAYCRYRTDTLPATAYPDNAWKYRDTSAQVATPEPRVSGGVTWTSGLIDYTVTEPYRFFSFRYIFNGQPYRGSQWSAPALLDFRGEVAFPIETTFTYNNNLAPATVADVPTWRLVAAAGGYYTTDNGSAYYRDILRQTRRGGVIPRDRFLDVFENYLGVPPYDRMRTHFNATDANMRSVAGYFLDIFKRTVLNKPDAEALRLLKGFGYRRKGVIWLGAQDTLIQLQFSDRYWAVYKVKAFSQAYHSKDFVYNANDEAGYLRNMRSLEASDLTQFSFRLFRVAYKFEDRPTYTGTNTVKINVFGSRNLSAGIASAAAGADGQGKEFLFTSSMTPQITDRTKLPRDDNPYDLGTNQNGQLWTDQANTPTEFFPYVLIISRDVPGTPARGTAPDLSPGSGWSRWGTPTLFAELGRDGLWLEYAYFEHGKPTVPIRPTAENMYVGTTRATVAQRNQVGFLPNTRMSATEPGDPDQYGQWLDEQPSAIPEKFISFISRMRVPGHSQAFTDWSEVKRLPDSLIRTQVFYLLLPSERYEYRRTRTGETFKQELPLPPDDSAIATATAPAANERDLTQRERLVYIKTVARLQRSRYRSVVFAWRAVEWMLNDFPDEFVNNEYVRIYRCQRTRQEDGTWGSLSRVVQMASTEDVFPQQWQQGKFLTENDEGEQIYDFPWPDTGNLDDSKNYVLTVPAGATTPVWAEPGTAGTLTPAPASTRPGAPSNVRIENIEATSATVRWTAPTTGSPVTRYVVQYQPGGLTHPKQDVANDNRRAPAPTSVDIDTLSSNTLYTFYVAAHNSAGGSTYAQSAQVRTPSVRTIQKPPTPTVGLSDAMENSIKATITPGSGGSPADDYVVEYGTSATLSTFLVALVRTGMTEKVIEGLTANTLYYFRAWGRNNAGAGTKSPIQSLRTAVATPRPPAAPVLRADEITSTSVLLRWTVGHGLTPTYSIYRSVRANRDRLISFGTRQGTSLRFNYPTGETYLKYRVDGVTADGTVYQSNEVTVTFNPGTVERSVPRLPKPAAPTGQLQGSASDSTEIILPTDTQDIDRRIVEIRERT